MVSFKTHCIEWDDDTGEINVVSPQDSEWAKLGNSTGCDTARIQNGSLQTRAEHAFKVALHMIIYDKMDPQEVHKAMSVLDEYHYAWDKFGGRTFT